MLGLFKDQTLDGDLQQVENGMEKNPEQATRLKESWPAIERLNLSAVGRRRPYQMSGGHRPKTMENAKRIDVTSRFVFPFAFASFNIAYWSHYLTQAQQEYEHNVLSI